MARATLIHNTSAGDGRPTGAELRELVQRHGYDPTYATDHDDLEALLQDPGDLVVAAGGDGTVRTVASRLAGRGIPLAILPIGTANNVAASLGAEGPLDRLAANWHVAVHRHLDVVTARGPWGVARFVESFGLGAFAHAMPILSALKKGAGGPRTPEAALRHDRHALARFARQFVPANVELSIDGEQVRGDYLLVEVMNGPLLGPRLHLAPDATPGDGVLNVVLITDQDREPFTDWIDQGPGVGWAGPSRPASTVEIRWTGAPLHIDGAAWAGDTTALRGVRTVTLDRDALIRIAIEHDQGVPVLAPNRRLTRPY